MKYCNIREGVFISRPNRFIAMVELDGRTEVCHVKNTGRCRELLVPGAKVLLEESDNSARKTKYDLVQVYKNHTLVNMDSQMPNYLVREWILQGRGFPDASLVQMEKRYGNSRFDLYVEYQGKKAFIEVKGVTLEQDGTARFPDAPTERGVKHIRELANCLEEGYESWIFFVIQMSGVTEFQPNWDTHPEFGYELQKAAEAGVHVEAWDCQVMPGEIHMNNRIFVNLS